MYSIVHSSTENACPKRDLLDRSWRRGNLARRGYSAAAAASAAVAAAD